MSTVQSNVRILDDAHSVDAARQELQPGEELALVTWFQDSSSLATLERENPEQFVFLAANPTHCTFAAVRV